MRSKAFSRAAFSGILIIVFLLLRSVSIYYQSVSSGIAETIELYFFAGEKSISEILEACFWLLSSIGYFFLFYSNFKKNKSLSAWYIFFTLFCIMAFGEETSWGQHVMGFSPFEFIKSFNDQNESNFHNLNIALPLHVTENNPLYYYFYNITHLVEPLFYLVFFLLWLGLPFMKMKKMFSEHIILNNIPSPSQATMFFLAIAIGAYLVIDKLFFDIGEIFELIMPVTAFMAVLDMITNIYYKQSAG